MNNLKSEYDLNFKKIFILPLHRATFRSIYVYSSNNIKVFTVLSDDDKLIDKILSIINGNSIETFNDVTYENSTIYINKTPIFLLRGWGYLTGLNGLNLSEYHAVKIQKDFKNFIIDKLKGIC